MRNTLQSWSFIYVLASEDEETVKLVQEFVHHSHYSSVWSPPPVFEWWVWSPLNLLQENNNKMLWRMHIFWNTKSPPQLRATGRLCPKPGDAGLVWWCKRWKRKNRVGNKFQWPRVVNARRARLAIVIWVYREQCGFWPSHKMLSHHRDNRIVPRGPDCVKSKFFCHHISFPKWCRLDVHISSVNTRDRM